MMILGELYADAVWSQAKHKVRWLRLRMLTNRELSDALSELTKVVTFALLVWHNCWISG